MRENTMAEMKYAKNLVPGDVFEYNGIREVAIDSFGYINDGWENKDGCIWTTTEAYWLDDEMIDKGFTYGYTNAALLRINGEDLVKFIKNMNTSVD